MGLVDGSKTDPISDLLREFEGPLIVARGVEARDVGGTVR